MLLQRLFILKGRPHPAWRAALYLSLYLSGLILLSICGSLVWVLWHLVSSPTAGALGGQVAALNASAELATAALALAWALALAAICLRWLDRAPFARLGFQTAGAGRAILLGLGLGALSMALVFGIFAALGWARVGGVTAPGTGAALRLGVTLALAAAGEEVIFRGYLLATLLDWRGWGIPFVVTSVLFGLAHLANPHISGLALFNITLAGAAFALARKISGGLWLPIAYHFAWNLAQGPLLGMNVSGLTFPALLNTNLGGPALWTGGAFGPEGGLVVTLVLAVSLGALLGLDRRAAAASPAG
jgi:hypothetical protein